MISSKQSFGNTPATIWIPTVAAALCSIFIFYYIDSIEKKHQRQDIELHTIETLNAIRSTIDTTINQQILQFEGIVAGISVNPELTDEQIIDSIEVVLSRDNLVRSVGLSRKYIVTAVCPLEGNEAAIGLNYLNNPHQLPSIQKAISTRDKVLTGPVKLVQGGAAIIVRMPIFNHSLDTIQQGQESFWGILSVLIDMDKLYSLLESQLDQYPISFAISSSNKTFNSNTVFYGDSSLFTHPLSHKLDIQLPNQTWQIAAIHLAAPEEFKRQRNLILSLGTIVSILITLTAFVFSRQFLQQRKVIDIQTKSQEQIWHAATHDRLTGMANRHLFNEELKRLVAIADREKLRLAVLFIDLDRFKEINDSFGHSIGDAFLKQFAIRLQQEVGDSDLLSRLGGDEFAIVTLNINIEQAADLAARVCQSLNSPIIVDHHSLHGGVSVGISIYPDDGHSPETLTHHADLAMYAAKENPLSSFSFFEEDMNIAATTRKQLIDNMRQGINDDAFYLVYQPIINIETNTCDGVETLIRWQHPKLGLIPPLSFIPAAESSGLIIPLGKWILETAVKEVQDCLNTIKLGCLSINLSAVQLHRGDPVSLIQRILNDTGFKPEQLDIEITESAILEDVDSATNIIHQVREMGVSVTIDDFGTGYSSLSHLQQLPVSRIKIDASFVRKIGEDRNSEAIIKAILFLSDLLDVKVTAEGVETKEQLAFLKSMGCQEVQGFYFAKPMPKEKLIDFCQTETKRLNSAESIS